jgi:DNA-binding transcriptional LysR family regulator
MFGRPGHPLENREDLSIDDLLAYPLAATQLPEKVELELSLASARDQPVSIQCDNFMVLKTLVAQSNVISMAPWDVIADDVVAGRLVTLPLPQSSFNQNSAYGLVSRAGHSLSPAAQAMRLQILEDDPLASE